MTGIGPENGSSGRRKGKGKGTSGPVRPAFPGKPLKCIRPSVFRISLICFLFVSVPEGKNDAVLFFFGYIHKQS